ncbi:hypothetical protein D3C81_09480 [compost metagenome]
MKKLIIVGILVSTLILGGCSLKPEFKTEKFEYTGKVITFITHDKLSYDFSFIAWDNKVISSKDTDLKSELIIDNNLEDGIVNITYQGYKKYILNYEGDEAKKGDLVEENAKVTRYTNIKIYMNENTFNKSEVG